MTTTTTARKRGASVKSDTTDVPVITDVPAQSDKPVIEDIPTIPVISDELLQIVTFATDWDESDKTGESGQLVTNYRMSTGTEAFATFARACTVEAANRTFGATVAGGMFPRIDDKPGASDKTIGKGQVSNLSGPVRAFREMGLSVSSVPLVWSRLSGSSGWRDKMNRDEIKQAIRTIRDIPDEADKVRVLLATPIPDKVDKEVDTTTELVKALQKVTELAEGYGKVKPDNKAKPVISGEITAIRKFLGL